MAGDLQSPFDNPIMGAPSGEMSGAGTSGGFMIGEGAQKETPNSVSGLPVQPTTVGLGEGDPGVGGQVPMPPVASPGTIQG